MVRIPWRYGWWLGLLLAPMAVSACARTAANPSSGGTMTSSTASSPVVIYASAGKLLRVYALDMKTGALEVRQTLPALENDVHYVAVHPNRKYLYVSCSELPPPENRPYVNVIHAFSIDGRTGALTTIGATYTSPLSRAIHISVDNTGSYLLMAHNFAESVSALHLNADGTLGEPVKQPEERQHLGFLVHQIRVDPSNRWVFVPVRGSDAKAATGGDKQPAEPEKLGHLAIFDFHDGVLQKHAVMDYPSGLGPRHLDFHPSKPWVYLALERGSRLLTYKHENGVLTQLFDTTTLRDPSAMSIPSTFQGVGPIQVHPSGKWVYVANRYPPSKMPPLPASHHGAGENDVAVFSIDAATGEPKLIQNIDTHGMTPRTMTIDPTGHFLVVANQFEGIGVDGAKVPPNLSVFGIGDDGRLTYVRTYDQTDGDAWWVGAMALPSL